MFKVPVTGRRASGFAFGLLACSAFAQPQAPAADRTLFRAIYQELAPGRRIRGF